MKLYAVLWVLSLAAIVVVSQLLLRSRRSWPKDRRYGRGRVLRFSLFSFSCVVVSSYPPFVAMDRAIERVMATESRLPGVYDTLHDVYLVAWAVVVIAIALSIVNVLRRGGEQLVVPLNTASDLRGIQV